MNAITRRATQPQKNMPAMNHLMFSLNNTARKEKTTTDTWSGGATTKIVGRECLIPGRIGMGFPAAGIRAVNGTAGKQETDGWQSRNENAPHVKGTVP
jgi:hypothetical protein